MPPKPKPPSGSKKKYTCQRQKAEKNGDRNTMETIYSKMPTEKLLNMPKVWAQEKGVRKVAKAQKVSP